VLPGSAGCWGRTRGSKRRLARYAVGCCFSSSFFFTFSGLAMQTRSVLEFDDIKKIAAAAEAEARKNNWAVTISIVDEGGHLLWLQRLDGAAPVSAHISPAKARTAALG